MTTSAWAGENYGAKVVNTRPQDSYEFKLSGTIRLDKNKCDHYSFHCIHPEIEYGITKKLIIGVEALTYRKAMVVKLCPLNGVYNFMEKQ
ncbi:hypothetical protein ACM9HF_18615 [Colwellia sp. RE-S-Sl-9]